MKKDGYNFTEWIKSQASHCRTMGLKTLLTLGPADATNPHQVHDLFPQLKNFFDCYSTVTIDQVTFLSNKKYALTAPAGLIEKYKDS